MAHKSRTKEYMTVFFVLLVLTILEVWVAQVKIAKTALVTALISLALAKAGCVALFYMHLKDETRTLRLMVGGTLLTLPPLYAIVLIAEAMYRGGW